MLLNLKLLQYIANYNIEPTVGLDTVIIDKTNIRYTNQNQIYTRTKLLITFKNAKKSMCDILIKKNWAGVLM